MDGKGVQKKAAFSQEKFTLFPKITVAFGGTALYITIPIMK